MFMRSIWLPTVLLCAACTDHARIYPMDDAASRAGIPKIEFVRLGKSKGPVTVTMPDGEVLYGEYQVTANAAKGLGAATHTAIRPIVISATGPHTILNCEGTTDFVGNGSGVCTTSRGNRYGVIF